MKLTTINSEASKTMAGIMSTCVNAVSLTGDSRETWIRLGKWGEYPGVLNLPGGRKQQCVQVLDREGAEKMKKRFYSAINQIAHLGLGLPVFEGHPDEPAWLKENPNASTKAVARFKDFEIREDGPYVRTVFNERGAKLVGGDAPELSAHSPRFQMELIPGEPNKARMVGVLSLGLTNHPNMPDTAVSLNESAGNSPDANPVQPKTKTKTKTKTKMNEELMKRLGLNPEASEDATATAVNTVIATNDTLTADLATRTTELSTANERITVLKADADKFLGLAVETTVTTAINTGRITEAQKPKWEAALKADFDGEKAKLETLMPTAVNTEDKTGDLGKHKKVTVMQEGMTAINTAVAAYGKEHNLDIQTQAGYSQAFAGVQAAQPELFKTAQ